jgi:glycosyltransferase involved in cell wall biosynthesis
LNSSKIGAIGALAGRIYNTAQYIQKNKPLRIIFTGHGWAFTEERPDWQRALIALLHSLTILLTHRTIAVSRKTREEVARIPFTRQKMTVIYNGVSNNILHAPKEALANILGKEEVSRIPKNAVIIGTLGELHKNKGHSYALEALATLKRQSKTPFRFIILGEGEERNQLERLRETLDLKEEVLLPGFNKDAAALLRAFDIFIFPSIKEGFPYAILEAGNAGLPVVATTAGGIPEVIDDMESGILIHSKNSGEIARALAYLIENPKRREQFGEAIKKRIQGRFTSDIMAQETFALYEKV